jgi:hypothetical protein
MQKAANIFWRKQLYVYEYCLNYGNGVVTILGTIKQRKRSVEVTTFNYRIYFISGWLAEKTNKHKLTFKTLEEGKKYVESNER